MREAHPDRAIARGLPQEAIVLAEKRLIAINRAMEAIELPVRHDPQHDRGRGGAMRIATYNVEWFDNLF